MRPPPVQQNHQDCPDGYHCLSFLGNLFFCLSRPYINPSFRKFFGNKILDKRQAFSQVRRKLQFFLGRCLFLQNFLDRYNLEEKAPSEEKLQLSSYLRKGLSFIQN